MSQFMRFCVKFLLSKLRLRKFFDKYHVCLPLHSHGIFVYLCIWSVNHLSFFSDKDFLYWPRPPPIWLKVKKPIFFMPPLNPVHCFTMKWERDICGHLFQVHTFNHIWYFDIWYLVFWYLTFWKLSRSNIKYQIYYTQIKSTGSKIWLLRPFVIAELRCGELGHCRLVPTICLPPFSFIIVRPRG